jgi:hypothetical protein
MVSLGQMQRCSLMIVQYLGCVDDSILASYWLQYTVLISKLSCNQRGHTVYVSLHTLCVHSIRWPVPCSEYRVSLDDRCRSVYPALIVANSIQPLTALLHRREWYPRPACFSVTASTVVSSFEVPSHRCTPGTKFSRHYPNSLRTFMDTCCHFAAVSCCNIGSLSPTLTMCWTGTDSSLFLIQDSSSAVNIVYLAFFKLSSTFGCLCWGRISSLTFENITQWVQLFSWSADRSQRTTMCNMWNDWSDVPCGGQTNPLHRKREQEGIT